VRKDVHHVRNDEEHSIEIALRRKLVRSPGDDAAQSCPKAVRRAGSVWDLAVKELMERRVHGVRVDQACHQCEQELMQ
jgi:hypothetical protein